MTKEQEVKNEVIRQIRTLMEQRSWTVYHLAKEANVPISTVSNMFQRGSCPSVPLIKRLSAAFGITLSEFFAELDEETKEK